MVLDGGHVRASTRLSADASGFIKCHWEVHGPVQEWLSEMPVLDLPHLFQALLETSRDRQRQAVRKEWLGRADGGVEEVQDLGSKTRVRTEARDRQDCQLKTRDENRITQTQSAVSDVTGWLLIWEIADVDKFPCRPSDPHMMAKLMRFVSACSSRPCE